MSGRGLDVPQDSEAAAADRPLLALTGIRKRFHGIPVLQGVSLSVAPGEVHALLGENGAGKSTLLKILAGVHAADGGVVTFDGAVATFASPIDAQRRGIVTIYQEFSQFPDLSVTENILNGHLPRNALGFIDWRSADKAATAALRRLGVVIDPHRKVADLSVAEQQLVEIARALTLSSRLIIMDEPTAALSATEVERLRVIIAGLKAHGVAIIFVGHRLDEVMTICDRYTVLRDGEVAGSGMIASTAVDGLVRLMVGRDLAEVPARAITLGAIALSVQGLTLAGAPGLGHRRAVTGVSFAVRAGEILGLAGLVGSGRSEIARALFGADPMTSGTIRLEGREVTIRNPRDAIALGIGLVPEDRKHQSLFPGLSVVDNFGMASLDRLADAFGWMRARETTAFDDLAASLGIRLAHARQDIATLSGGNQQKVVLARWLAIRPKILIIDEPTRGIDIAAKADVHRLVRELAARGVAVILVSSELSEILALSHRILTLRSGRLTGEVTAHEASEATLLRLMTLEGAQAA